MFHVIYLFLSMIYSKLSIVICDIYDYNTIKDKERKGVETMHRREALKLIEADMKKFSYKEVGFLTDCRTYMNVTVKSPNGTFYRYIYDELSRSIRKYNLTVELSTEVYIGTVESEVK